MTSRARTGAPASIPDDLRRKYPSQINLIAAAWLVALAIISYFLVDTALVNWVREAKLQRVVKEHGAVDMIVRWPGHLAFALLIAGVVLSLHPWRVHAALVVLCTSLFAGSNWILKWVIGRPRPRREPPIDDFNPFAGGLGGLFDERNLSMPSGDVTLAFALATALSWMLPRWRWRIPIFAWAVLVAVARVARNAHHLSDVLAGAALGLVCFHLGHGAVSLLSAWAAKSHSEPPRPQSAQAPLPTTNPQ